MFNTKVQRHSFGIQNVSEHAKISSGAAANEFLRKRAVMEHYGQIDEQVAKGEKELQQQQVQQAIVTKSLLESQIPVLINELSRSGKEIIFKDIVFEMFSKSLVLDEDFVIAQEENLRALVESFIDGKGGYSLLENAYRETKSPFLKAIKTVCEATANTVARRKMSEAKEDNLDVSCINFELSDDEKEELEYSKEKVNVDQLSKLVKEKVLTVVQDEKERQAKEEEVYQDLEEQTKDGESVEESIKRSLIKDSPVEESTLFNSIFRHSYKEALESTAANVAVQSLAVIDDDDDNEDYDVDSTEKDVMVDEFKEDTGVEGEAKTHGTVQSDIDMDLILAESITKYTLMELAHTIQLESHSYDSIRKISQQLLN